MSAQKKTRPIPSFGVLSGIAQELDAPLQSLSKTAQKLINEYKSRDFEYVAYKDFKHLLAVLEQINSQLKRCCKTTGRLMRLSRSKDASGREPTQVNDIVREILGLLSQQMGTAKIRIAPQLARQLPLAAISKVECFQVVHNVLQNALQALPGGGWIKVKTAWNKPAKLVTLDIEDNGIGITQEHLAKIFEPFFTTKERGVEKSTGLGLSIVYAIVQNIGGDIHVESSLRKGTAVHIALPVPVSAS